MENNQSLSGPSLPVQLPHGWNSSWSEQYQEHFYTNTSTGQSQWEMPSHPVTTNAAPGHNDKEVVPSKMSPAESIAASQELEKQFLSDYDFNESGSSLIDDASSTGWSRKRSCRVTVKRFSRLDEKEVAKANREIFALDHLSDPAIPPIIDIFDSPANSFVVLETRKDESLKKYMESRGSIPDDLLKALLNQFFGGLATIFMEGLTHLRICDETLFIDNSGQLTIKDFHYAHAYSTEVDGRQYALVDTKYGSDMYVAPETWANDSYNGRKATLWSCGVAIYFMVSGQLEKLSTIEHPLNNNMQPVQETPPESRRESVVEGKQRRRSSLSGRKLSVSNTPILIHYPGTSRFDVPNYARDIISKLLITNPLKRAELIEVAAKVPKEFASKLTRPLMELAWLDYKTHVGPLAGLDKLEELDSSASSVFSGVSKMSNPLAGLLGGRRRSTSKVTPYDRYA